ncbi:MAG: energy transducer TonB [Pseudomonadota bacterium]
MSPELLPLLLGLTLTATGEAGSTENGREPPVEDFVPMEHADSVDSPPIPIKVPTAGYPRDAIRRELSGAATACFTVDRKGRVRNPSVVETSHELFRKPTLKAIRKATFKPARLGADSVATSYCRTYRFSLEPR